MPRSLGTRLRGEVCVTPCFNSLIPVLLSPDQSEGGVQTAGILLGGRSVSADHPPPPPGLSDGGR